MNTSHNISLLFTGLIDHQTNKVRGMVAYLFIAVTYEYFPQDQFTVYMTDRPPNKQGQSHGGVTGLIDHQTNKVRVMVV